MLLVVPEAALAAGGPAHLRMKAQRTERVRRLPVGGTRRGGVHRHPGILRLTDSYRQQQKIPSDSYKDSSRENTIRQL